MRISDWSSDVCSSDLVHVARHDRDRTAVAARFGTDGRAGAAPHRREGAHEALRHVGHVLPGGFRAPAVAVALQLLRLLANLLPASDEPVGALERLYLLGSASCRRRVVQYVSYPW